MSENTVAVLVMLPFAIILWIAAITFVVLGIKQVIKAIRGGA